MTFFRIEMQQLAISYLESLGSSHREILLCGKRQIYSWKQIGKLLTSSYCYCSNTESLTILNKLEMSASTYVHILLLQESNVKIFTDVLNALSSIINLIKQSNLQNLFMKLGFTIFKLNILLMYALSQQYGVYILTAAAK